MSLLSETQPRDDLCDHVRNASAVTPGLMQEIVGACRRYPVPGQSGKAAQVEHLIGSGAWVDVALALIDLELPQWHLRRLAYDDGEWYCALSRERELPDWLDQSIEARHADLALAILRALVEAERIIAPSRRTSVPSVAHHADPLYEPVLSDDFA